jgi:hypothetical protein
MRHPDDREARFQPEEPSRRWSGAGERDGRGFYDGLLRLLDRSGRGFVVPPTVIVSAVELAPYGPLRVWVVVDVDVEPAG